MAPTLRKRAPSASQNSVPAGNKVTKAKTAAKSKSASSVAKTNGAAPKGGKSPKKGKVTKAESETSATPDAVDEAFKDAKTVYDFKVNTIHGEEVSLEKYKGHVLVIVNVASNCGHTKRNYEEFVQLDEKYRDAKGLRILAFPCNQFAKQEPGDSAKIISKIEKFNVKFDVFEKIDVNGATAHPLYKFLKSGQHGLETAPIKWNFAKFIIDKEGKPVERFLPGKKPLELVPELEKYW